MSKSFVFTLESFEIEDTRSSHEDTDYVSFTLQVGAGAPQTQTKAMGDLNNGTHAVGLSFGPVAVAPNEAAIFNYLILNSGHQSQEATQDALTKAGKFLAEQGAAAATKAIASGVGSLVGASVGSAVLPLVGTALGALAGWLVGQLGGLIFADCDGPVAAEQIAMTGAELAAQTANGQPIRHTTLHPGTDSPAGCGDNSRYKVTWQVADSAYTKPSWLRLPGLGKDIGVGANGSVWLIGTNPVGAADDCGVYTWNGTDWVGVDGGGVRIAVDPAGQPWLVNSVGEIYRRL